MSDQKTPTNVTPMKGFRQAPKPTKGELEKENTTLGAELQKRLQGMQQFFGNLIQQLMRSSKNHETELSQISQWLGAAPTTDACQKGDNLIIDYAGVLLNDDGTPAKIKLTDVDGNEVEMVDLFDGGNGKLFMLTNLGGGTLIPGFEEQMIGLKAGEGKQIEVQFPKEYGVPSLREKKAQFTLYIHAVNRPYVNSPVGDLIDQNTRIRAEAAAKAQAEAAAKAQADAEAAKAAAPAPEAPAAETPPAETPAPAETSAPSEAPTA